MIVDDHHNDDYDYIDDHTLSDAIMDRLTAKSSKMSLKGDSLRKSS